MTIRLILKSITKRTATRFVLMQNYIIQIIKNELRNVFLNGVKIIPIKKGNIEKTEGSGLSSRYSTLWDTNARSAARMISEYYKLTTLKEKEGNTLKKLTGLCQNITGVYSNHLGVERENTEHYVPIAISLKVSGRGIGLPFGVPFFNQLLK